MLRRPAMRAAAGLAGRPPGPLGPAQGVIKAPSPAGRPAAAEQECGYTYCSGVRGPAAQQLRMKPACRSGTEYNKSKYCILSYSTRGIALDLPSTQASVFCAWRRRTGAH